MASVVAEFCSAWGQGHRSVEAVIGFGIGALFFLGLLIYTLFFALPFEETYCEDNKLRAAYTEGMYGVCRHPGVFVVCRCISLYVGECLADGNRGSIFCL